MPQEDRIQPVENNISIVGEEPIQPLEVIEGEVVEVDEPFISLVDDINDEETLINGGGAVQSDLDSPQEFEMQSLFDALGLSETGGDNESTVTMQSVIGVKPDGLWGRKSRGALAMYLKRQGIADEIVEGVGGLPITGSTQTALEEVAEQVPAFLEENNITTFEEGVSAAAEVFGVEEPEALPEDETLTDEPISEPDADEEQPETAFEILGQRESSNNYEAVNRLGYLGKYQFGDLALQDLGFKDKDGNWIGKDGITSPEEFLKSPEIQDKAIEDYFKIQEGYLKAKGALEFIGAELDGIPVTEEGLLMAAHLVGAGAVSKMLKSGEIPEDANGTTATDYMKLGNSLVSETKEE